MENEIIMNEEAMDQVMELVPEQNGNVIGKIVGGVAVVGAVAALGYQVYRIVKTKRAQKAQASATDNVKVVEHDFLEEPDENEEN